MLKFKWSGLIGLLFLVFPSASHAYRTDFHFYLTHILAHECGLGEEAYKVAWANYSTDKFFETDSGVYPYEWIFPSKVDDRRLFHFAIAKDSDQSVSRGSKEAFETIVSAVRRADRKEIDPYLLGIGLHTLQDSWAHEGFRPMWGHFWTTAVDYPGTDQEKALQTARATWEALDSWSRSSRGRPCDDKWVGLENLLGIWLKDEAQTNSELAKFWRSASAQITGRDRTTEEKDDDEIWHDSFIRAARKVKKEFGAVELVDQSEYRLLRGESQFTNPATD